MATFYIVAFLSSTISEELKKKEEGTHPETGGLQSIGDVQPEYHSESRQRTSYDRSLRQN
jgi:hypothetical protein